MFVFVFFVLLGVGGSSLVWRCRHRAAVAAVIPFDKDRGRREEEEEEEDEAAAGVVVGWGRGCPALPWPD